MSTTSKIAVSEGSGKNVATYSISEDAATKELGRNVNVDSSGAELGVAIEGGHLATIDTSTAAVNTVLGAKTDAKNTATDTTSVSAIGVLKQISASVQAPPSQAVTNAGTFAVQATLQAASGVDIGKLTANQSVNQAQVAGTTTDTNSGNKSAGSQRVVVATDDINLAAINTATAASKTDLDTLAGAVTSSIVQSNVAKINNVTPLMGAGATGTGSQRVTQANDAGKTLVSTGGSASSSGNNTLVTAGTNKLKVYAFSLSTTSSTAVTCIFQSGASGTELWRVVLQAPASVSTGANLVVAPPAYLFATASATLLNLNLSGAQTVHWSVSYYDEA